MVDAEHTPPGDAGFRASLLRAVVGALGLVAFVAVVFGAIGMLGRADDLAAGEVPEEPAEEPEPGVDDTAEPEPEPDPAPEDPVEPEEPADDPDPAPEEPGEPEPDTVEREFPPGDVTVQVLDGYQQDGGTAAARIAALLREEGYLVVAENPAIAYEVTTVLWTAGFEGEARQVAAEIGAAEVREQPGNLSTQVQVHVVVGADRG